MYNRRDINSTRGDKAEGCAELVRHLFAKQAGPKKPMQVQLLSLPPQKA
jgi:hypothetical protein